MIKDGINWTDGETGGVSLEINTEEACREKCEDANCKYYFWGEATKCKWLIKDDPIFMSIVTMRKGTDATTDFDKCVRNAKFIPPARPGEEIWAATGVIFGFVALGGICWFGKRKPQEDATF